ncbi:MAG: hypothetical protein IJB18_03400 [Clostridia bacterium]|nr:hypothetical protein [Clostridia bacterium]MBQ8617244.1 hypothetical protein [Clostridia bacterium]
MKKIFEIDRDRLLPLVRQELETSQSFQKNIDGAVQHFLTNPYNAQGFTDGVRFNHECLRVYLNRAAAMLELIGCFDSENETTDYPTLSRRLDELSNREEG